jgi:hypothetical protein
MRIALLNRFARLILEYTPNFRKKLKNIKEKGLYNERKRYLGKLADNEWVKEIKGVLIKASERGKS